MDIVIFGQRVHLRLALQAPEGCGKDDPVIILVKIGPAKGPDIGMMRSKARRREQFLPVHHRSHGGLGLPDGFWSVLYVGLYERSW